MHFSEKRGDILRESVNLVDKGTTALTRSPGAAEEQAAINE